MRRRLLSVLAVAIVLVGTGAPVTAQEVVDAHSAAFRRAELAERSLGDLEGAAELYLASARAADDPLREGLARLRAAACYERLGKQEDAVGLAEPWADAQGGGLAAELRAIARGILDRADLDPPPSVEPERGGPGAGARGTALETELEQTRQELEQTRQELEQTMSRAASEAGDLAERLREKDREMDRLRRKLPPDEAASPEELLARRQRELTEARALSRVWTELARLHHQDGRFEEARAFLYDALAKDKNYAPAKALLARVAAPLGDREHLFRRMKEVLALATEVRAARLTAEVQVLVQQGRRRQESGDLAGAVAPLERALALIDSGQVEVRGPFALREEVERRLRRGEAAGVARRPVAAPAPEPLEKRWTTALRALLEVAGEEVAGGLELRFHDLDAALPPVAGVLPPVPVSDPPAGWTLSARGVRAGPLLTAWVRSTDRRAFSTPGARLEVVGATAVAVAERQVQRRTAEWLAEIASTSPPAVEVEVIVISAPADAWRSATESRGIASFELAGGAVGSVLSPGAVREIAADGGVEPGEVLGRATFSATHLRPFRLSGGRAGGAVAIDVLPIAGRAQRPGARGVGMRLATTWLPPGRSDTTPLASEALAGSVLAPGGALLVRGLMDPAAPERDLVALVRVGRARGSSAPSATADPAPELPLPVTSGRMRAAAHVMPVAVGRVTEVNATAFAVGRPLPTRRAALLARLRTLAPGATTLELRDDRVLVVGPETMHDAVTGFLAQLGAAEGLQRFRVEAHAIDSDTERQLLIDFARLSATASGAFAWAVAPERTTVANLRRVLARRGRELHLAEPVVAAPPTVRADAARVLRTPYRRELDAAPGEERAWGRAETAWMDQGFLVALRPFGHTRRGRVDVDVELRVVWTADRGEHVRDTALGTAAVLAPRSAVVEGALATEIADGDVLVLAALPNPFDPRGERPRMVILVRPER